MDCTPEAGHSSHDSGCISNSLSFDTSSSIWGSTPKTTRPRCKRKRFSDMDIPEAPATPQFSSTLNESLCKNLKACGLETPEKLSSPAGQFSSPAREQHDILYYNNIISNVTPKRKILTPRKAYRKVDQSPLEMVLQIPLIMDQIAGYLSNGEVYRLSQTSKQCQSGVMRGYRSRARCLEFKSQVRMNKENYRISPPCSPRKSPEHQSDSIKFDSFTEVAKLLSPNKSLAPCISCGNPSVVDKNIRQCQSASCGTIHCVMCGSISKTGPQDFKDKCGKSTLAYVNKLDDISNRSTNESLYYTLHHYYSHSQDSGISSEGEISPGKVRKNLFSSRRDNISSVKRLIDINNRSIFSTNQDVIKERSRRKKRHLSYTPVITRDSPKRERITASPSPPPKSLAVGSAQSRKNLKRLTR